MDYNDGPPSKCKIVYPITKLLITTKRERKRKKVHQHPTEKL